MSSPTSRLTTPVLCTLSLLGSLQLWGRAAMDGTLEHLFYALHGPMPYNLPSTRSLLKESFTGMYWPFDYLLNILVVFFWEVADGSHPDASAVGIYFLGQYLAVLLIFYLDSCRTGLVPNFKRSVNIGTYPMFQSANCDKTDNMASGVPDDWNRLFWADLGYETP
ncbi:hypothetical protein F4860DRAFT_527569 [Xylaria cubensis]|nr:hypothetical protein F4860DRAFT_527569 [Xylaria cubensis]